MIQKQLSEIIEADLLALINNKVAEGRTIEYKRDLPSSSDSDKKEFLADVSSLANTSGGDLLFGMSEDSGFPTELLGIELNDRDQTLLRLENILTCGLSPRIRYQIRDVEVNAGKKALIIRVDRSWSGPHRVVYQGSDKFFGRNSAGKYPLDVNELRTAFTLSSSVTERIRAFRSDRIIALSNNEAPVPFVDDPKIVLHCIPVESFASQAQYNVLPLYKNPMLFGRWEVPRGISG